MNHCEEQKWRCKGCGKLLGVIDGGRLEIRFARGHQYRVALPATCVCRNRRCNTLNELPASHARSESRHAVVD